MAQGARMLAECEYLRNLTMLDLSQLRLSGLAAELIGRWQRRDYDYSNGPRIIESIAESPYLKNLTSLHLSGYGETGGEMIAALADSPLLGQLTDLDLSNNGSTARERPGEMAALDLSHNGNAVSLLAGEIRSDLPLAGLFLSPHAVNLRHLTLIRSQTSSSVGAFYESPHVRNLQSLRIDDPWLGPFGYTSLSILADSPNLQNLVRLDLSGSTIDDQNAQALFESNQLRSLKELNLNETGIGDVVALADSPLLANLRCLKLQGAGQSEEKRYVPAVGLEALAASPLCQNLAVLDLGNQPVADGVKTLAKSENLQELRALGLWKTGLSDAEVPLLCDAGGAAEFGTPRCAVQRAFGRIQKPTARAFRSRRPIRPMTGRVQAERSIIIPL